MNANALSVYVSTCRLALSATIRSDDSDQAYDMDSEDNAVNSASNNSSWTELHRLLSCLRQSLTCTVCNEIALDPVEVTSESVAVKCRPCTENSTSARLITNVQGKILVQCYRKLCVYLESTNFYRKLGNISANGGTRSLANLIREGASLKDVDGSRAPASGEEVNIGESQSRHNHVFFYSYVSMPIRNLKFFPLQHVDVEVAVGHSG